MAYQDRDEEMIMSMKNGAEQLPLSVERNSTSADKKPSVPDDTTQNVVRESNSTGSELEENGNKETLDIDTLSESRGSDLRNDAQQQLSPSSIIMQKIQVHRAETYEIKTDEVGNEWFCVTGMKKETVYHSDIRYDLQHHAERSVPRTGRHYKSILGAGTDDQTSYHPQFDFCGKERADRPDCLFYLYKPYVKYDEEYVGYLLCNDKVVLDYKGQPMRAFDLPLTISSRISREEARLEAMMRSDTRIQWGDILARIMRRGETPETAARVRNRLNESLVRFRVVARLLSFDPKYGSKALEIYILTIMTAEMVAKNTTKGLTDIETVDEKAFVKLLNLGIRSKKSQIQNDKDSKKKSSKTQKELKNDETRRKQLKAQLVRANAWTKARIAWEAKNPTPASSIYGDLEATAIESIVAFKLASMDQLRCDGSVAYKGSFMFDHAAPYYPFDNPRMEKFFGSPAYCGDAELLLPDANDPYGLLSSPSVNPAQTCLVDFLLEPARAQYRRSTIETDGYGKYRPIFMTDPTHSYWQQLQTLQSAFEQHLVDQGYIGQAPVLCGLLGMNYDSVTWNIVDIPLLNLVRQAIDSSARTFARWQRQQAEDQIVKLRQRLREHEKDEENGGRSEVDEGVDDVVMEEIEGEDDVVMEGSGGAE